MSKNKLKTLPRTIYKASALEECEVTHNKIKKLPKTIGQSPKMGLLNVSHNTIKTLPKSVYMLQDTLDASDNQLISLPDIKFKSKKKGSISHMNLANNKLTKLPIEIQKLVRLSILNLENNGLEEIPESLFKIFLIDLKIFDLFFV